MIKFEKVSYEQFEKDSIELGYVPTREIYDAIKLPTRSTKGSAGYDFVTPYKRCHINSDKAVTIPTGIRVSMPIDVVLMLFPRSGLGFKYGMRLTNSTGIIDSDYYSSSNEGHIMAKIRSDNDFRLDRGDRFMQGVFVNYLTVNDDNVEFSRSGGFGSTGK